MVSKDDMDALRRFSQKGYELRVRKEGDPVSQESLGTISSVEEEVIESRSGYFAICDDCRIDVYADKTEVNFEQEPRSPLIRRGDRFLINYNAPSWSFPKMMQEENFISFRTGGDGLFPILSSHDGFYVTTWETDYEIPINLDKDFLRKIHKKNFRVKLGSKEYKLEGLVGVEGGRIGITDPEIHKVSYWERYKYDVITIVKVKPGAYACRFIENGKQKGFWSLFRK